MRFVALFVALLLPYATVAQSQAAEVTIARNGAVITVANGRMQLQVHSDSGLIDYFPADGLARITSSFAGIKLADSRLLTTQYPTHALAEPAPRQVTDSIGRGMQLIVRHTGLVNRPKLDQIFTFYADRSFITTQLRANSSDVLESNWIAPLMVAGKSGSVTPGPGPDPRLVQIPFDNDDWFRINAHRLVARRDAVAGTGFEFTTIYESTSGRGWVIGSITHDFWKTGIDFVPGSEAGRVNGLTVYGGAATTDTPGNQHLPFAPGGTHDVCPHGAMTGKTIESPTMFVGYFNDFRDGLQAYGQANAAIAPALKWNGPVPLGWMSFGAFAPAQEGDIDAASDFLHEHLQPHGFGDAHGQAYINIDASGLSAAQLRHAAEHIHHNRQLAGFYMSPFLHWSNRADDPLDEDIGEKGLTFKQIVLRDDDGHPISSKDRATALDVSNPATLRMIARQIDGAKRAGFDYFKLDFLSAGALEGHHVDPEIHSGIQAYNRAMRFIVHEIGDDKFISLSIAPMFPSQYGHSRRVSCDIYSQLNNLQWPAYRDFGSTEYMLSCATFLWWMGGSIYPFNDPDAIELVGFQHGKAMPETWVKSRIVSAIVSGGNLLDASDYADPLAVDRAMRLYTNPRILAIARKGLAFRPLIGNLGTDFSAKHDGSDAADVFYRDDSTADQRAVLMVVFNYSTDKPRRKQIPLRALGIASVTTYQLMDVWSGETSSATSAVISCELGPGEAALLRITLPGKD